MPDTIGEVRDERIDLSIMATGYDLEGEIGWQVALRIRTPCSRRGVWVVVEVAQRQVKVHLGSRDVIEVSRSVGGLPVIASGGKAKAGGSLRSFDNRGNRWFWGWRRKDGAWPDLDGGREPRGPQVHEGKNATPYRENQEQNAASHVAHARTRRAPFPIAVIFSKHFSFLPCSSLVLFGVKRKIFRFLSSHFPFLAAPDLPAQRIENDSIFRADLKQIKQSEIDSQENRHQTKLQGKVEAGYLNRKPSEAESVE